MINNHLFTKIINNELNQNKYLISGKELWLYDILGNLSLINSSSDTIRDFMPFYNK